VKEGLASEVGVWNGKSKWRKAKVISYRVRKWRKVWIGFCVAETRGTMGDADNVQ